MTRLLPMLALNLVFGVLDLCPALAYAQPVVEDVSDVNGLGSGFREVQSGRLWLDYSNFFGQSYSGVQQVLQGTGFRLATKLEVEQLFGEVLIPNAAMGQLTPFGGQTTFQAGFYDDSKTGSDASKYGSALISDNGSPPDTFDDAVDDTIDDTASGSFGAWVVQQTAVSCNSSEATLDFDCDGKDDKVVWRRATGTWFVKLSDGSGLLQQQWGLPGDRPLAGDFDGDGIPDLAVWRPSTAVWYIKTSKSLYSVAEAISLQFGLPGDSPLRIDFDGDGRLDVAVWRPSTGTFFYVRSIDAAIVSEQFGLDGDVALTSLAADH